jgi:hypothetical protein
MDTTGTSTAIWEMPADRRRKTIKAKALSPTERGYLYPASPAVGGRRPPAMRLTSAACTPLPPQISVMTQYLLSK